MAIQFVNYFLDDFNDEQVIIEYQRLQDKYDRLVSSFEF